MGPQVRAEAAEVARWLAFLHVSVHGNAATANAWMARAGSMLAGLDECAAQIYDAWAGCQHFFLYDDVAPAP